MLNEMNCVQTHSLEWNPISCVVVSEPHRIMCTLDLTGRKGRGSHIKGFWIFVTEVVTAWAPTPINLLKEEKSPSAKMGSFTKIIIASICVIFLAVKWTAPRFDEGKTERQPSADRLVKHARTEKPVHMHLKCSRNTHWVLNSRVHSTCDIKEYILSSKTIRRKCVCGCGVPPRRTAFSLKS